MATFSLYTAMNGKAVGHNTGISSLYLFKTWDKAASLSHYIIIIII